MKTNLFFRNLIILVILHTIIYDIGPVIVHWIINMSQTTLLNPVFYKQITTTTIKIGLTTLLFLPFILIPQKKLFREYIDYWQAVILGTCFMFIHVKIISSLPLTIFAIIGYNGMYLGSYKPLIENVIVILLLVLPIYIFIFSNIFHYSKSNKSSVDYNIYLLIFGLSYSFQYIPINSHSYRYLTRNFDVFLSSNPIQNIAIGTIATLVLYYVAKKGFPNSIMSTKKTIHAKGDRYLTISFFYSLIPASLLSIVFKLCHIMNQNDFDSRIVTHIYREGLKNYFHLIVITVSLITLNVLINQINNKRATSKS